MRTDKKGEKEMFKFIKGYFDYMRLQKKRAIAVKRYVIKRHLIDFYEDLQTSSGEVNTIPPCTLANQLMKEVVRTDEDVNRIYKNLRLAGAV